MSTERAMSQAATEPERLDAIAKTRDAAVRYALADGLEEIVAGVLTVIWAVVIFSWPAWRSRATIVGLMALAFAALWAIPAIQRRVTHARLGYVDPPAPSKPADSRIGVAVVLVPSLFFSMLMASAWWDFDTVLWPGLAFIVAIALPVALIRRGRRHGTPRFYLYAAATAVAFLTIAWAGRQSQVAGIAVAVVGSVMLVMGTLTFLRFLRLPRHADAEE
jgi:hypothetical protein